MSESAALLEWAASALFRPIDPLHCWDLAVAHRGAGVTPLPVANGEAKRAEKTGVACVWLSGICDNFDRLRWYFLLTSLAAIKYTPHMQYDYVGKHENGADAMWWSIGTTAASVGKEKALRSPNFVRIYIILFTYQQQTL